MDSWDIRTRTLEECKDYHAALTGSIAKRLAKRTNEGESSRATPSKKKKKTPNALESGVQARRRKSEKAELDAQIHALIPPRELALVKNPFDVLGKDYQFESLKDAFDSLKRSIPAWVAGAPVYLVDVDIAMLYESRRGRKNSIEELKWADDACEEMSDIQPMAMSCRIVDKNKKLIVAYFSWRLENGNETNPTRSSWTKDLDSNFPVFTGDLDQCNAEKCCIKKVEQYKRRGQKMAHDGFEKKVLDRLQIATQAYASIKQPTNAKYDVRHRKIKTYMMRYKSPGGPNGGFSGTGWDYEIGGTLHKIQAWQSLGHETADEPLYVSADIHGNTATEMMAAQWYSLAITEIAILLAMLYKASYPAFYAEHKKAFDAGKWFAESEGPWLGIAIVYKLQTDCHLDSSEGLRPVAIFCVGQFEEGYLELPDVRLRFYYRPGDVAITFAGVFYHRASPWTPSDESGIPGVAPGRIAITAFTPDSSMEALKDKTEEWCMRTAGARLPMVPKASFRITD